MKVIEIIEIRSAREVRDRVQEVVAELRLESDATEHATGIHIFEGAGVSSDIAVHLHHHGPVSSARGSQLALHLVETLKEYALVHHTIWREIESERGPETDTGEKTS